MTREEAINILSRMIKDEEGFLSDNTVEAHKMAIQALEQEPCDKCVYSTKDGYCQYDDITETIPPLESCDEAISKQAVMDCFKKWQPYMATRWYEFKKELSALPPVTPQPKMGHWIKMPLVEVEQTYSHKCSLCGRRILAIDTGLSKFPYCHCGARMVESQEGGK